MELNRLNELGNFISHFKKVHAGNRAAAIAAARLEKADKFGQITPEALDREGKIDWEGAIDEGYETIRSIRDFPDAFEPDFELGTDAHAEWVSRARAEFE